MTFVASVTAPFRAGARPLIVAPVVTVIDSNTLIVPAKADPVPMVAGAANLPKDIAGAGATDESNLLPEAVVSVEPAWKIQTSLDPPESVSVPVSLARTRSCTPGVGVWPPGSATTGMVEASCGRRVIKCGDEVGLGPLRDRVAAAWLSR